MSCFRFDEVPTMKPKKGEQVKEETHTQTDYSVFIDCYELFFLSYHLTYILYFWEDMIFFLLVTLSQGGLS